MLIFAIFISKIHLRTFQFLFKKCENSCCETSLLPPAIELDGSHPTLLVLQCTPSESFLLCFIFGSFALYFLLCCMGIAWKHTVCM